MDVPAVATTLIKNHSYHGERFAILVGEDGQFYAVRSESPYFCFAAHSEAGAHQKALSAMESYFKRVE